MNINTKRYTIQNQASAVLAAATSQVKQAAQSQIADSTKNKLETVSDRVKMLEAKSLAAAHQVKDAATRFQENNFGGVVGSSNPGSALDVIKGSGVGRSRNPLDQQGLGMVGSRNGQVSEDPKEEKSTWDTVKEAAKTIADWAYGAVSGPADGAAWTIITSNTNSPDDKKNEFNGFLGLVRQGRTGTSNENAREQMKAIDGDLTPNPEADTPSGHVYGHDLKGIDAKKGSKGEPTGEEGSTGGPVNTGANGTGRTGSLVIVDPDLVATSAVVAEDFRAMRVRIESKINVIR
ncbi:MAG: hypothetical protein K2Q23_11050 [Bryobacteraceae bacterium]|nr:hypothetical protein [Bryobacteraceae bacterium]